MERQRNWGRSGKGFHRQEQSDITDEHFYRKKRVHARAPPRHRRNISRVLSRVSSLVTPDTYCVSIKRTLA